MNLIFTLKQLTKRWIAQLFIVLSLTCIYSVSYAQIKNYATTATIKAAQVDNANNATSAANSFATVKSRGGTLGLGKYSGELELKFPSALPANTTSFIRIDSDADLLNVLLGGNLGSLLADILGNVVLGDHVFEVGARSVAGATLLSGSSAGGFSNANLRLIKDGAGFFYIAITPNQAYDKVYIKDITNALVLGPTNETRVYNAFYFSGTDACASGFATSFSGNGLTVDALGLGKAGVTNPERAIDADPNNFSEISLGALGVAGAIMQDIYFSTLSTPGDEFSVRLSINPALINAGILNNITISAYRGSTEVFSQNLNALLSVDLLGLLNSGRIANVPFKPTLPFDRVRITLNSLLNASLTQTINLYSVFSSAARPTFTAPTTSTVNVCYNASATLSATTTAENELVWYDVAEGGTALASTAYNVSFVTPSLQTNKTFYVAARKIGCTAESIRVPIDVVVNPEIIFSTSALSNANTGTAYNKQISLATGGSTNFTYALTAGSQLPAGLVLSTSGQIGGIPATPGDYNFSVTATDSRNCNAVATYNLKVTPALSLPAASLPNGTVGSAYQPQIIPTATGGSGSYTYVATNLPPGLSFDETTRAISGTPTQVGNYNINIVVTDSDGNQVSNNYNLVVKDPLVLASAVLADGIVGQAYLPQTILPATGGTLPYTYAAIDLPPGLSFNASTREISGTPSLAGTFIIPVTVTDGDGKTATVNYTIRVQTPLSLPGQNLPDGNVNAIYTPQALPAASGGIGPYTYIASNLPAGLVFDATTREITGTPTQSGNFTITLTARDAALNTISNTYQLKVIGALNLPTAILPDGLVGQAYPPQTLPAVSGGTSPYSYVATNLPPGLSFNTTTREITGTPTAGGNTVITLTATDAAGNSVSTNYSIMVNVTAPIVANATICSGASATLTVTNIQPGVTYNWYGPTGNSALASNNNGTFITPIVNATTTFYVESVSGTATSGRTSVVVSVNPAPNMPVILTANQIIGVGQNTILEASANAGETINWYANSTGGTRLASGPNFTTPNLSATTTFYAEAVSATGCSSLSRSPVTVTVLNGSGAPDCNYANSQNSGISGICIGCSISNPTNPIDADLNNFSRISLAVGVAAQGYQRLIFASPGVSSDSIRLDLAIPTGLLDLSVLSRVTITVMNGASVVSSYQLNSSLVNLKLLGGTRFNATFAAGGIFDRVEVRFAATAAAVNSLDIYSAAKIFPNPIINTPNTSICAGSTASLSATPSSDTNLSWYSTPVGGTALATGSTFTTPVLSTTTTFYLEVGRAGCANSVRLPITVTVTPVLAAPVIAPQAAICQGSSATLSVTNADAAITYQWFDSATDGQIVFTGASFPTPSLQSSKTYFVQASQNGCTSATRTSVTVVVNSRPQAPQVQVSSSTVSPGQTAVLTATSTEPNVGFNWFDSPTATNPIFSGGTFITPPLNATTSYFVESVNTTTSCTSASRIQVTITVDGNGVIQPIPCEAASAQTNGKTGLLTVFAGVSNPNLAVDNDAQTGSTLFIPVGLAASVYQRLAFADASSVGDTVKILVNSPGRILSASVLGNLQIATYNAGSANNDAVFANNAAVRVELLGGNAQALITIIPTSTFNEVEIRLNSGLVGALTAINVNYAQRAIAQPIVTPSTVTVCANQPAVLTVQNFNASYTYKWYSADGTLLTTSNTATYTTPAIITGTTYFVTVSSPSGCESAKTAVNVGTSPLPIAPELRFANVNTCTGSSAVLEVQNPIAGNVYKWYDAQGIYQAGKDGVVFTTPLLTANTTYQVVAENNCGTSAPATATITLGTAVDAPIVTPAAVTVSAGSPAVLMASSSASGAAFNWYASANGTTPVFTGPTFVTPPLTANTTYYVEAVVPGPCPASGRTSVLITVVPNGNPVSAPCGAATIALADGVSGIALFAGVSNPNLAIDNDIQSGSTLVIPVGAAGASVLQRVGFDGGLSHVGDTLRIKLSSPAKLLSLGLLQNISLTTFNGSVSNADLTAVNNPLIKLELLNGGSSAILNLVPSKAFDGVELRLNSGLLGALTSINFDYAQRIIQAPNVVNSSLSVCQGAGATLSVSNPQAGVTYRWFLGNTFQAEGTTFTTPATLVAGTYTYNVRASAFGCESVPTVVTVIVSAPPAPPIPVSGNPTGACIGSSATLGVQAVAGVTYNWYDAAGNVLVLNSATFNTPIFDTAGTFDFFVEAINGNGCPSASRTTISINVNPLAIPSDFNVNGNLTICGASSTTLTASSSTVINPVFSWYRNADLTDLAFTGSTFTTPTLTSNTTYYVTVKGDNVCESLAANAKVVLITIKIPAVSADISVSGLAAICAGNTANLTASSSVVTNPVFTWYRNQALTDVAFTGATFTTPPLTVNTTYYLTVKGDNRCENAVGDALVININVNRNAIASDIALSGITEICNGSNTVLSASSTTVINPIFTWYSDAALTTVVFNGSVFTTPALNQSTTYFVTVSGSNACANLPNNAAAISVKVKDYALASDITATDAVICAGSQATLSASTSSVTDPIFTWYSDSSLTIVAHVGSTFIAPALATTTKYFVTVKGSNRCENLSANAKVVTVQVNALAGMADLNVSGVGAICSGSVAQLTASSRSVSNPIFSWYADSALTNLIFVGPSFTSPPLFLNTIFYVTVKGDNLCENDPATAKAVEVIVSPAASAADVTVANDTICQGSSATLQASTTTVTNPVFTWYSDAALTTVTFVGPTFITPNLNTNTTYYVTVKGSNTCESTPQTAKVVTVTINPGSQQADLDLSVPAIICGNGTATIIASSGTVINPVFTWYSDASLTSVVFIGSNFTTPNLSNTTTYYVTVKGDNKCENTPGNAKSVTVVVKQIATAGDIVTSGNTAICANGSTSLTATSNSTINPVYTWYSNAALTDVVFVGSTFATPNLTATTTYYVTVKGDNKCENTPATAKSITVTVGIQPANPIIAGAGQNICAGQTATFSITNPADGVKYEWYVSPDSGTPVFVGPVFTTPTLNANTTYYVQAVGSGGCTNAGGRVAVQITVTSPPAAPTVSSNNMDVCVGSTAVLMIVNPAAGIQYNWYTSAVGGTPIGNGVTFTTGVISSNITYYAEAVSVGCQSGSRTQVAINALPLPMAPVSVTAVPNPICAGSTTIITVNNPDPKLSYKWYTTSTGGLSLAEGSTFTTPVLTSTTIFYVESISILGGCTSNSRTAITANVLPVLTAPRVVIDNVSANAVTFSWSSVSGSTGFEVSVNNGTTWMVANGLNSHTILGLKPGESITIVVRAIGALPCQTSTNSMSVTGTASNPFMNDLFIPNTFTPNGDGKNDIFLAYGNTVSRIKMSVYNQWGEYLFESNSLTTGWDGVYKGNMQPSGVYVYYVDVTFNDGTTKFFKGTITLLR
ncbi:putative Ig domain-containing protein [Pedobacter sandarakinus]|nr:putative Ig domain-containing protein [Pedobacter sandarakinus]